MKKFNSGRILVIILFIVYCIIFKKEYYNISGIFGVILFFILIINSANISAKCDFKTNDLLMMIFNIISGSFILMSLFYINNLN